MNRCDFSHWCAVWRALGCQGDPAPWHHRLLSAYGQKHRHYHTLVHIQECLEEFDQWRSLSSQPIALEIALWFHDAIYDPRSVSNEADSADSAVTCLKGAQVADDVVETVRALILSTQAHSADAQGDSALVVDIDLAIFGRPPLRFWEYEHAIAAEYSWVPREVYAEKRAEVLQKFVDRSSLYLTPPLAERFESTARENLRAAIERLRSTTS